MADFDDLDSLDDLDSFDDLGDLEDISFDDPPVAPVAPVASQPEVAAPGQAPQPPSGLATVLQDLLDKRNYQQVVQIAESQKETVLQQPEMMALAEVARTKLEQESFIQGFVNSARQAQAAGQVAEANQFLAKAKALDSEHPAVAELAQNLAAPAVPAAPPSSVLDTAPMVPPTLESPPAAPSAAPADDLLLDDSVPLTFDDGDDLGSELQIDPLGQEAPAAASLDDLDSLDADFAADFDEPIPDGTPLATPAPASLTADADEADFGGAVDFDAASGGKIQQLLAEGQAEFDKGEYQGAIDLWSRIFLVDIDHAEASSRIEDARAKKAERERQAEEIFHQAIDLIEAESLEEAQTQLTRVLELQPGHSTAREYLEQLQAGQVPVVSRGEPDLPDLLDDGGFGELDSSQQTDGEGQSMEAAIARDRMVVVKRTDRKLLGIAGGVGLAVMALIAFLVFKWDDLFPNAESEIATAPQQVHTLDRAIRVHDKGNVENAIRLAERITPGDERYKESQALLASWRAQVQEPPEPEDSGPSEESIKRRNMLLSAARTAHDQRNFIRSRKYFDRANKILPLEADDLSFKRNCDFELEKLQPEIDRFGNGEYGEILPILWVKLDADEDNPDIKLLIVDSYWNLALTDLQRGDTVKAAQKLDEAMAIEANSPELKRVHLFATSYHEKGQDLLYRIFVKYLPSRS